MKQGFITFLCLFISLNVLTAQAKIHSKTTYYSGRNQRGSDELYTYLPQRTIVTTWDYYTNGRAVTPTNQILQYNDLGQKVLETVVNTYYGGPVISIQNQIFYKYGGNGCLIEQTFTEAIFGKTPYSIKRHVFKRNNKCQIKEETITTSYPINPTWNIPLPAVKTFQYDNNDSLLTLSYRYQDSLMDYGYSKFERSSSGKPLIQVNLNASDFGSSSPQLIKFIYTYDSLDRYASISTYRNEGMPNSVYILENTIKNSYNTEGLLSLQIKQFGTINYSNTLLTYNCDKSLKEVIIKSLGNNSASYGDFLFRYVYTYADAQPCPPVESGDFTLFPNPTCNFFSIQSPSLKSGNWKMTLVDALGKVQMQQKLNAASEIFDFWLTDLPSGLYYVRLTNGQERMVKKLFIAN